MVKLVQLENPKGPPQAVCYGCGRNATHGIADEQGNLLRGTYCKGCGRKEIKKRGQ